MARSGILVSTIVPVFNEEQTIGNVIARLRTVLEKMNLKHEILVVDDCSTDKSAEIARQLSVNVFVLNMHKGKGYALRVGFSKAKGEIIATVDSDGSHRPEELPRLLNPILKGQADLVIGSRLLNQRPLHGRALNDGGVRFFNALIHLLTGTDVSDSQSGYRALKASVLKNLKLVSIEYEIESEMLVKITKKRFRVIEVPVTFEQRTYGKSRLDPLKDGAKILFSILSAYIRG
jgi:glycosyltransferase involved in cell wall biosynthesis